MGAKVTYEWEACKLAKGMWLVQVVRFSDVLRDGPVESVVAKVSRERDARRIGRTLRELVLIKKGGQDAG